MRFLSWSDDDDYDDDDDDDDGDDDDDDDDDGDVVVGCWKLSEMILKIHEKIVKADIRIITRV